VNRHTSSPFSGWFFLAACSVVSALSTEAAQFAPKVMVVTTFEIGADTGDKPGEFQFWVEREGLTNSLQVPGLDRPVRHREDGLFGCVSGTTARAGQQLLMLGCDPRFDFSKTYWLINGIAGIDPENASVGSAAWARWVVDGDLAFEIDSQEIPKGWPYGIVPLGGKEPNQGPQNPAWAPRTMAWRLNPGLVAWAYSLTASVSIPEVPQAVKHRKLFSDWPAATEPAKVFLGESLGSCRYWHGRIQNRWANDWVRLHTGGEGDFAMTNMEDHGLAAALDRLASMGKVDFQRVLVLRTGSNYCVPEPGQSAAQSMTSEYQGMLPALESAHRVGSTVVHRLLSEWSTFKTQTPSAKP
jgi:purine nucleoside permease